jgi:DNA-binding NtrC family response regulator
MVAAQESSLVAIVDDDPFLRRVTRAWFEGAGYRVAEIGRGVEALEKIDDGTALVCLDLGLEDLSGLDVLQHLRGRGFHAPVIVITAESDLSVAVEAMRRGAYDYVLKPLDRERLLQLAAHALAQRALEARVTRLQQQLDSTKGERELVGESAATRQLEQQIDRVSDSDVTVCIRGESGTGKELVARAVHRSSRRKDGPFVAINCAAIPASLQESELFGHERGAFTGAGALHRGRFEQANHGTLFLDELGEMSLATQAALLRTLQERSVRRLGGTTEVAVDVRIVCATHRDLSAEVAAGRFREDLYYRLVVYPIDVAPLRARVDDLPALVAHFLRKFRVDVGRPIERVSADALEALAKHPWPGNVRELQNVVHRAMLACDGDELELFHLPAEIRKTVLPPLPAPSAARAAGGAGARGAGGDAEDDEILPLRELERRMIAKALAKTKGSPEKAAALLGISRATMYRRLSEEGSGAGGKGS